MIKMVPIDIDLLQYFYYLTILGKDLELVFSSLSTSQTSTTIIPFSFKMS